MLQEPEMDGDRVLLLVHGHTNSIDTVFVVLELLTEDGSLPLPDPEPLPDSADEEPEPETQKGRGRPPRRAASASGDRKAGGAGESTASLSPKQRCAMCSP